MPENRRAWRVSFARRRQRHGEHATIESEEPLRADGLAQAIKAALAEASRTIAEIDFRITDISGEQYAFKEASLAGRRRRRLASRPKTPLRT